MSLESYLAELDGRWSADERMVWSNAKTPGYHTRIPDGTHVHQTRESMDYALALLVTGEPARVERADAVIERIVSLQNQDPTHAHYGIWSWFAEEPLEMMDPPDWNWADFIGARLAQVLAEHEAKLTAAVRASTRTSLGHAAWSVFRRNVGSGYTNIATMGAGVTLAAGEILGEPRLLDYGRRRLGNMVRHVERHGEFTEYNSPTYTRVALEELERILQLVRDPQARADAERLRRVAWQTIADHFHPGTQQWAGPHSRAYADRIGGGLAKYLREQTGVEVTPHAGGPEMNLAASGEPFNLVRPLPCPADLVERFRRLPQSPYVITRRFVRRDAPEADTVGTTWFDDDACLASVSRDTTWNQRRVLIGYWRTDREPAVVFRVRVLKNGRDFAPAFVRQAQAGPRVLTAYHFTMGAGDFHPIFGCPPDFVYPDVTDLRIRFELNGRGVGLRRLDEHRVALTAGGYQAVVHAPNWMTFEHRPVRWETAVEDEQARFDGVFHAGPARDLGLKALRTTLATAVELLPVTEAPTPRPPELRSAGPDAFAVQWTDGLSVAGSGVSTKFAW